MVGIYSKKLHTRKFFLEKSRDHIHDVIYRLHLSRAVLNLSFQLTPCHETFVQYVRTTNCTNCIVALMFRILIIGMSKYFS